MTNPIDISEAPGNWQAFWFTLDTETRATIESHHETARELTVFIDRLDVKDPAQYIAWKQVRANSGWSMTVLGNSPIVGISRTQIGRYENGRGLPRGSNAIRYKAMLTNMAVDQYHFHLVWMAWALFWAEQSSEVPANVTASKEFLAWCAKESSVPGLAAVRGFSLVVPGQEVGLDGEGPDHGVGQRAPQPCRRFAADATRGPGLAIRQHICQHGAVHEVTIRVIPVRCIEPGRGIEPLTCGLQNRFGGLSRCSAANGFRPIPVYCKAFGSSPVASVSHRFSAFRALNAPSARPQHRHCAAPNTPRDWPSKETAAGIRYMRFEICLGPAIGALLRIATLRWGNRRKRHASTPCPQQMAPSLCKPGHTHPRVCRLATSALIDPHADVPDMWLPCRHR
jgi:hypothetical protein